MNEKIVYICMLIVLCIVFYILCRILHHGRTDDGTGKSIDRATTENNGATKSVKDAETTADGIGKTTDELSKLTGRSKEIIEQIKQQKIDH